MFEILLEIIRPVGEVLGSWPGDGSGPCAGRFCMVGDPRQTIYDRAALGFYHSLNEAFRNGDSGDLLAFRCTNRCAAAVVETVNRIFRDSEITENEIRYDDLLAEPDSIRKRKTHSVRRPDSIRQELHKWKRLYR